MVGLDMQPRKQLVEAAKPQPTRRGLLDRCAGRLVRRSEFESLDQARKKIITYIDSCHHCLHSGRRYRTPPGANLGMVNDSSNGGPGVSTTTESRPRRFS